MAGVDPRTVRDESGKGPYRWPCLHFAGYPEATTTCEQRRLMTREEEEGEARAFTAAIERMEDDLRNGRCPHCHAAIERRKLVGRCEYAEPCGHRLGQVAPEEP